LKNRRRQDLRYVLPAFRPPRVSDRSNKLFASGLTPKVLGHQVARTKSWTADEAEDANQRGRGGQYRPKTQIIKIIGVLNYEHGDIGCMPLAHFLASKPITFSISLESNARAVVV
jgi:hypothetical protein